MKEKLHVLRRIRTNVSLLLVGRDFHYTIGSTTLDKWQLIDVYPHQSTGHFSFETFVCIMAISQIK